MNVSSETSSQQPAGGENDRPGLWERIRRLAAWFWVGYLMLRVLERHPRLVRVARPFFLWFTWNGARVMRRNLMLNARRILGDMSTPAERRAHCKRVLENFYDFIHEVGSTARMSKQQMVERIASVEGRETYDQTRALKRGAIIVTAHLGSYELGVVSLRQIEPNIHVVLRSDTMDRFEEFRSRQHERLGVHEAKVDEGVHVWMKLRDALNNDEVVLIQGDRVMPGQKGKELPFLHGHVRFPTGPVKLSFATGAPIVPIFSVRDDKGKVHIHIEKPIFPKVYPDRSAALHEALVEVVSVIERYVRRYPDQWLRVQRAFCEDTGEREDDTTIVPPWRAERSRHQPSKETGAASTVERSR
jgi:lauroyl/myristoyl acyltransferase